jgi:hypothetical protein
MGSNPEFEKAVGEFLGAFEVVFHHDWKYTRSVIGDISRHVTFMEDWRETEDWGARRDLLDAYGKLVAVMKAEKLR